jgi:hypothetical protein
LSLLSKNRTATIRHPITTRLLRGYHHQAFCLVVRQPSSLPHSCAATSSTADVAALTRVKHLPEVDCTCYTALLLAACFALASCTCQPSLPSSLPLLLLLLDSACRRLKPPSQAALSWSAKHAKDTRLSCHCRRQRLLQLAILCLIQHQSQAYGLVSGKKTLLDVLMKSLIAPPWSGGCKLLRVASTSISDCQCRVQVGQ